MVHKTARAPTIWDDLNNNAQPPVINDMQVIASTYRPMQSTLSPATARGWNKGVAQTLFVTIMPIGGENKQAMTSVS